MRLKESFISSIKFIYNLLINNLIHQSTFFACVSSVYSNLLDAFQQLIQSLTAVPSLSPQEAWTVHQCRCFPLPFSLSLSLSTPTNDIAHQSSYPPVSPVQFTSFSETPQASASKKQNIIYVSLETFIPNFLRTSLIIIIRYLQQQGLVIGRHFLNRK